jgi:serine/threonine kinase 38
LERKLADVEVFEEEKNNLLKYLERKETEYMRLQRHKMGVDDFKMLTIIGRGAFGEMRLCREKTTGNVYAMKKLKKSEMLRRGQVEHVKAERNLLVEVDSNCIVKLYCSFQDDEHPTGRVNIGGDRSRENHHRIPKEVRKLLQNEEDACSQICMNI